MRISDWSSDVCSSDLLGGASVDAVGAAAVDYLRLFALVSIGWMWTRMATVAAAEQSPLHSAKLAVANFYAQRILPQARGLATSISAGEAPIMADRKSTRLNSSH